MESTTEQKHNRRPAGSHIFQVPQKRKLIFCLLLALATIALYNPVTHAPFLNFDDVVYVTGNPQVRAGTTWNTVVWAFHTTEVSNWHPITWLSHALDCQIFGLNPAGPHTVNVLLHAANAVLLFLILEGATGLAGRSLMVAALFALHPINVESVAWISERKNVLSMLFFLLALAAYGWYARRPGVVRYLAVTFAYVLGLMTKPQVITFPFALLLLDYWPLYRLARLHEVGGELAGPTARGASFLRLIGEKAPWFALSAVSAVVTMKVQTDATQVKLSPWIHLGNAAIAYVKYLGKAFWPLNLAPVYPHPELAISVPVAALSAFAIITVSILAVIFRQRRPLLCGVVLVPWNGGTDDRTGAGWRSGHGRPLRLYPIAGSLCNRLLGCGGSNKSLACSHGGVCSLHLDHSADTGDCASSASEFLDRQSHPVDPHSGNYRGKLRR
jgi:protein O-mannosyl-transferase